VFKISDAQDELSKKTYHDIQKETAYKWGSRAIACFINAGHELNLIKKFGLIQLGEEYRHESIEHAALVEDAGKTLAFVQAEMEHYRSDALKGLEEKKD
jgi:hypothetical protein